MLWPEHTLGYVVTVSAIVLIFAFFFYLVLRTLNSNEVAKNKDWVKVYNWAIKRKLSSEEISTLEFFFNEQKSAIRRDILKNVKRFRETFLRYLIAANLPVKHKVHLAGKLFPEIEAQAEINSLDDIQSGEFCMLEQENSEYFCRISSKNKNIFRLKCSDKNLSSIDTEGVSSLYIYRFNVGGYNLPGSITGIAERIIEFNSSGNINFTGIVHLMAEIDTGFELSPEPHIYLKDQLLKEAEMSGLPPPDVTLHLLGQTNKISDRGLIFRLRYRGPGKENSVLEKLKYSVDVDDTLVLDEQIFHKQHLWKIKLVMPDGMLFQCRGRVLADKHHKGYLLFRYESPDPKLIKSLIGEINKIGAIQEKLI